MRSTFTALSMLLLFTGWGASGTADELTDRQQRVRQILQQDQQESGAGAAASAGKLSERQQQVLEVLHRDQQQQQERSMAAVRHPALLCARNDYAIRENGRKIIVRDAEGLHAAMKEAKAGDVIELGAGEYGWVNLHDLSYSDFVKLQGADGAKIKHLGLTNVKNLQIEGVHFEYGSTRSEEWKPKVLEMKNVQNVRIINSTFVGNRNAKKWKDDIPSVGIRAYDGSKNIVISGSRFSHIMRGVIFQQVDGYTIENNSLIDMGCDGLFFQNSSNGLIESNYLSNFRPFIYAEQGKTCHADFIQFDAGKGRNKMTPSSNVTIRGNVMLQGPNGSACSGIGSVCGAVQGVFLEGAMGIHPEMKKEHKFTNITISDNLYCASGINGLYVNNGRNVKIINNAHYTCPPPGGARHASNIVLRGDQIDSVAYGNIQRRVSGQEEAIKDATTISNFDNCVLETLSGYAARNQQ